MVEIITDNAVVWQNFSTTSIHDDEDVSIASGFTSSGSYPVVTAWYKALEVSIVGGTREKALLGVASGDDKKVKDFAWSLLLSSITGPQLKVAVQDLVERTVATTKLRAKAAIDALPLA